jgi:hypothetical protein
MEKTKRIIKLGSKDFRRLVGVKKETYREMLKVVKRGYKKKGKEEEGRVS